MRAAAEARALLFIVKFHNKYDTHKNIILLCSFAHKIKNQNLHVNKISMF